MPGAGKSTIGVVLAKNLGLEFIDTDLLIQTSLKKSLQQIINESGHLHLRAIEEQIICSIETTDHIIATGGSAVYSEAAMTHLEKTSDIIFLEVDFGILQKRIHNFSSRGIAKSDHQSFQDLFNERQVLYKRYAQIVINGNIHDQEELAKRIAQAVCR
jgi:shikimate kinase